MPDWIRSTVLPGLQTLIGGLFGFVGMIIGVPVFAVIYDIIRKLVNNGVVWHEMKEMKHLDPQ